MQSWSSAEIWLAGSLGAILVAAAIIFYLYRENLRRKSLRQREDGMFIWLEWHGGEGRSYQDPSKPGGAWHDNSSSDDFDGDSGDLD